MSIARKDFSPIDLNDALIFKKWESVEAVLVRANEWIEAHGVQVINIETVLLPDDVKDQESQASTFYLNESTPHTWRQVVRVWYQVKEPPVLPGGG